MQRPQQESERPLVLLHSRTTMPASFKDRLSTHFRLLDPHDSSDSAHSFLSIHAGSVRAIVCYAPLPLTSGTLSLLPSLELIVCSSVGVDHVDLAECRRRGVIITNAGSAFCEDVSDYTVALLLDVLRRLSASDRYVRAGLWPKNGEYPLGFKLGGKRIGIVGLGRIGSEVAKRLEAFGCSIAYNSRKQKPAVPYPYNANILELATNSDVLILCCSLTDETRHIINRDVITALGKEGVIINVGRGALIDEKEMVQSLMQGELGGAGLDVFENEPDVPKELFTLDNVVLSPHRAVITPESVAAVEDLVMGNLIAFFSNEPLLSPIQLD